MEPPFPPFDPDDKNNRRAGRTGRPAASAESLPADNGNSRQTRLRDIPLRTLFPNFLTLLAICSGLTAIRFAIENRIELAIGAIILAAFLDGIDGRVARFLKSTTRFGAQMDSLADFVNFGVAPAMILYFTMLEELRPFGWVAALIFAICACLRLARFNVELDNPSRPSFQQDFFVGVPAPAGAMIVLLPAYLLLWGLEETLFVDWVAAIYVIFVGLLMVSNLPTYSGKTLGKRIPNTVALPMIISAVVLVALLLSYPWQILTLIALGYLVALPFGRNYYNKLAARHAAGMGEAAGNGPAVSRADEGQAPMQPAARAPTRKTAGRKKPAGRHGKS